MLKCEKKKRRKLFFLFDKRSRSVQLFLIELYYIYYFMHEIVSNYIYYFITEIVYYIMHGYKFRFVRIPICMKHCAPAHDSGSHSCSIWKRAEFY